MLKATDIKKYEYDRGDFSNHCEGAHLTRAWKLDGTELTEEELEEFNSSEEFYPIYNDILIDAESSEVDKAWQSFKDTCAIEGVDPVLMMASEDIHH